MNFKLGEFPDPLRVEHVLGNCAFRLLKSFRYIATNGEVTEVPVDFLRNGASSPKFWWRVMGSPFVGKHRLPSVIHDWLWTRARRGLCSYSYANLMFWDGLRSRGMGPVKAWLMWAAVWFNALFQRRPRK